MTVDTSSKFRVVTKFITDKNSTSEYVPDRRTPTNEISTEFCSEQKEAFGDVNTFEQKGGMSGMGATFSRGMVLVMSIWDDHADRMFWLDSRYPFDRDANPPSVARGTLISTPDDVESQSPNAQVTFSNIRF
ncbi:hypothetical protein VKT23_016791 [Stygiomarasmius scandens]|uniref:Glucanase n=1 Tax=Marasmiellus scandens TaxID=2682957 RepID=A0ABR1IU56_9AGAR